MDRLLTNQQLNANDELVSNNGWFRFRVADDGSFGIYRTQARLSIWSRNSFNGQSTSLVMQGDGNCVAFSSQGDVLWSSDTQGHPGANLVMQNDGNLVVYDNANRLLWASNTVQDLQSPTIRYLGQDDYSFNETSESWKELCRQLPCFAALKWPGYTSDFVEDVIDGQPVVIQLWKGWCPKFLGFIGVQAFPGGVGAEVGVYRRIPGKVRPTSLPFLPKPLEDIVLNGLNTLTDNDLWWPFPEIGTEIEFTLINPINNQPFFSAGSERSYWLAKWMDEGSYSKYQTDLGLNWPLLPPWFPGNSINTPMNFEEYALDYRINGVSYPRWGVGKAMPPSPLPQAWLSLLL